MFTITFVTKKFETFEINAKVFSTFGHRIVSVITWDIGRRSSADIATKGCAVYCQANAEPSQQFLF